jgi:hypothetical protein
MFATAGRAAFVGSQFSAAMMPDVEPEPEQLSTRTPRRRASATVIRHMCLPLPSGIPCNRALPRRGGGNLV